MKALFLAPSSEAWGETLAGLSLARQIRHAGIQSRFVIHPNSKPLLARSGFAYDVLEPGEAVKPEQLIDRAVGEFTPDAMVLSDYFMYVRLADMYEGFDPWFIDRYELPTVAIDFWELDATPITGDIFGGARKSIFDERDRLLRLSPRLRPAPPCHVRQNPETAFAFRLWDQPTPSSRSARTRLRKEFGVPASSQIVLLTISKWQVDSFRDPHGDRVADLVPALLAHYLRQLPARTHFAVVGEVPPRLALPPERTYVVPPCDPGSFDALVSSADLVVTMNLPSTTLARAVMADVPAVAIVNRHGFANPRERDRVLDAVDATPFVRSWTEQCTSLYPFRIWPIGMYDFLEPLLADNSYFETVAQAELLDERGTVRLLEGLLGDARVRTASQHARAAYRAEISTLPDAADSFVRAVSSVPRGRADARGAGGSASAR